MTDEKIFWQSVSLLPDQMPLDADRITALTAQLSALGDEARDKVMLQAMKLARSERIQARQERVRKVSRNVKMRAKDVLALTRLAGSVTMGYRMLRCLHGDEAATCGRSDSMFTSVTLPETLLDALPDGSKALGELLCAATMAFHALPATTLSGHVERSAASDWGARKAKEKTYPTSIRITSAINDQLRAIGRGNVSAGARAVFRWALAQA